MRDAQLVLLVLAVIAGTSFLGSAQENDRERACQSYSDPNRARQSNSDAYRKGDPDIDDEREAHMPKKQTKQESAEETLSSVKKEMAKPRMALSAREMFSRVGAKG